MPLPPSALPQGTPVRAAPLEPPVAPRRPHVTELHGERREDPWAWLRHRDDPEVIRYLEAHGRLKS